MLPTDFKLLSTKSPDDHRVTPRHLVRLKSVISLASLLILGQLAAPVSTQGAPPAAPQTGQAQRPDRDRPVPKPAVTYKQYLDPSELAAATYKTFKEPVVIVLADNLPLGLNADLSTNAEDFGIQVRKWGLNVNRSNGAVVYQDSIPLRKAPVIERLFRTNPKSPKPSKIVTIPDSAVKDDLITFETKPGELIDISKLGDLKTTKSLRPISYFGNETGNAYLCAVKVVNLNYIDFARMIAKAVGGRMRTTAKEVLIEQDGTLFRGRAHKLLEAAYLKAPEVGSQMDPEGMGGDYPPTFQRRGMPSGPLTKSSIKLMDATLNAMNNNEIENAFSFTDSSSKVSLTGRTDLQSAVVSYFKSMAASSAAQNGGGKGTAEAENQVQMMLSSISRTNPGDLTVGGSFSLQLHLLMNSGSNNGNRVGRNITLSVL